MPRTLALAALLTFAVLAVPTTASAAWNGPGTCRVPADQRSLWKDLDTKNNTFSTTKVPCYMAGYTVRDMIERKAWRKKPTFRHRSQGARWVVRLSCTNTAVTGGRLIKCRVTSGDDAETNRDVTRSLKGGTIRWKTAYGA